MEIILSINCEFDAVFLVNGVLIEGGDLRFGDGDVVYITAFPLDAMLLPYTVKLVGGQVKTNKELCRSYRLSDNKYYLKLEPRYNYVYSPIKKRVEGGVVERFFEYMREGKLEYAREYLSAELNGSLNNLSLGKFFDGYTDIIAEKADSGLYYLIDGSGKGTLFNFVLKDGLIDNIIEDKH